MTSNNTKAKLNIAIILSGTFLVMLNQQLLSPALPAIMDEMGVGATTVQWLQSAYAMIIAILVPLSAHIPCWQCPCRSIWDSYAWRYSHWPTF